MHDNALDEHILNIIQNHEILEQSDLQILLKKRGYNIPQATSSRKLKKLKIAKVAGMYKVIAVNQYRLPLILNMQISDFGLIVLHTQPGQASSLAYFLDQKYVLNSNNNIGIIGAIAGDDTVLLIIKNKVELNKVLQSIYKTFPYLTKQAIPRKSGEKGREEGRKEGRKEGKIEGKIGVAKAMLAYPFSSVAE